jgi:hypothetical protein
MAIPRLRSLSFMKEMTDVGKSGEDERVTFTGQAVLDAASYYPPMIIGHCYDSAEILAGVYSELRTADGIRLAKLPGDEKQRRIEHGWCVKQDGTIVDAVFAEEIMNDPELDPAAITVTYIELIQSQATGSGRLGVLRDEIRRRAREATPPLVSPQRRWKFAEKERDKFQRWLEGNGRKGL